MAAANNMLAAEGEIGAGRDITTIVPGGFTSAGSINANLRTRAAATFLYGVMGTKTTEAAVPLGTPPTAAYDAFTPADLLPYFTIEKRVGTNQVSANQLLTIQYTDCIINTLNIAANSGALSTIVAGVMTAGEQYVSSPVIGMNDHIPWASSSTGTAPNYTAGPWAYQDLSNDLLVFHGGRIQTADAGGTQIAPGDGSENDNFMSMEIAINNNVQGDEWTIRPSRFLHSFTEGIRDVEVNMTIVFNDFHQYQQYTYGASGDTIPGYHLYQSQLDFTLANWQLGGVGGTDPFSLATGSGDAPALPQAVHFYLPNVVIAQFPVQLATGRIVVTTNGRAVAPIGSATPILEVDVNPTAAAF